jgi:hypothetical protein
VAVRSDGLQMPARQEEGRVFDNAVLRPLPSLQSACFEEAHDDADQAAHLPYLQCRSGIRRVGMSLDLSRDSVSGCRNAPAWSH